MLGRVSIQNEFMDAEILAVGGSVAGAGGIGLFMIRYWIGQVDQRLDRLAADMQQVKIEMASRKGEIDGRDNIVWRDLESQKIRVAKLESSVNKAWDVVHKIAQPRISDLLEKATKED